MKDVIELIDESIANWSAFHSVVPGALRGIRETVKAERLKGLVPDDRPSFQDEEAWEAHQKRRREAGVEKYMMPDGRNASELRNIVGDIDEEFDDALQLLLKLGDRIHEEEELDKIMLMKFVESMRNIRKNFRIMFADMGDLCRDQVDEYRRICKEARL